MMQTPTPYQAATDRYDKDMSYRRCGRSGVLLPALSLGLWHNFGENHPHETAKALAHYAFDQGITHFDLANNYGPPEGAAERFFGQLMRDSFAPHRDELFVATKAAYDMWPGPYGSWASRKHLTASLDQSLRRMRLDYVDLFYCHRYDPETPLEETLQALTDIVRQGKALYVGLSRWPLEATTFAFRYLREQHTPCLIYQGRLNLFDQAPKQAGILAATREAGAGFIAFSPLAQGLLTDRYLHGIPAGSRMTEGRFLKAETLTPDVLRRIEGLDALARKRGESLASMALAWVLHHEAVTSVIVGASSTLQLAANLKALEAAPFSPEELAHIDTLLAQ